MLSLALIAATALIGLTKADDATLYLHCDNQGSVRVDGTTVATFTDWTQLQTIVIPDFEDNPLVEIICEDLHVVGGVIATLKFRSKTWSTKEGGKFIPVSSSDGVLDWVYKERDTAIWGLAGKELDEIAADAEWIWNGKTHNEILIKFQRVEGLDADLYLHCDDAGEVYLNQQQLASFSNWKNYQHIQIPVYRPKLDKLTIKCRDTHAVIGGLLATLYYRNRVFSTGPDSVFTIVSSSDGITTPVYYPRGSSPWNLPATSSPEITYDAQWTWNGKLYNEMVFEVVLPASTPSSAAVAPVQQIPTHTNAKWNVLGTEEAMVVILGLANGIFILLLACWCYSAKSSHPSQYKGVDYASSEDDLKEINAAV